MTLNEIFPNPTVKNVHFEIRFPNLFYIEKLMGDIQLAIMEKFPESQLIIQRQFLFAHGTQDQIKGPPPDEGSEPIGRIWKFKSPEGMEVDIQNNSLAIHSNKHKTYQNPGETHKFRDLIEFVVSRFLTLIGIPLITRVGLRYIDECPIVKKDNKTFSEWYNTTFPLGRFDLSDASEMTFATVVTKGIYRLRYAESLQDRKGKYSLLLDFDGFTEKIQARDYLSVTDALHKLISDEYCITIKAPLREFMRQMPEMKEEP